MLRSGYQRQPYNYYSRKNSSIMINNISLSRKIHINLGALQTSWKKYQIYKGVYERVIIVYDILKVMYFQYLSCIIVSWFSYGEEAFSNSANTLAINMQWNAMRIIISYIIFQIKKDASILHKKTLLRIVHIYQIHFCSHHTVLMSQPLRL